jgi:aryl-alcohol dehydrogenase-like predicted oxidoreductase
MLGRPAELGMGGYFSNPTQDPVDIIKHAYKNGVRLFDTSPAYGESEKWFGEALQHYDRNRITICTKTKAKATWELYDDFENSLLNLKVNYIDIYYGHDFINDLETFDASFKVLQDMNNMKNCGLIKEVGVSGHSSPAAIKAIDSGLVDVVMIPHSIALRAFEEVIRYANIKKIKVITMKNFGSGILLGGPGQNEFNKKITLKDIIGFSAWFPGVTAIIPAFRSKTQFIQTKMAYEQSNPMSDFEIARLTRIIIDFYGKDFCRFCNLCRPCEVYGWQMSQPGILKSFLYDKKLGYDMKSTYDKNKLTVDACTGCDSLCSKKCPFSIDIKDQMMKASKHFEKR